MGKHKDEEEYDVRKHLSILNRFYLDVSVILSMDTKRKKKVEALNDLIEKTNKKLWPILNHALTEDLQKPDSLNKEIYDLLDKVKEPKTHRK